MTNKNENVSELIDQRIALYGEPVDGFTRIATVWSGILGHEIQPCEVPLLMMGLKLVRTQVTPDYSDNSDDIEGYLDIFRTIVGEDMVHARLSSEYWAQKGEAEEHAEVEEEAKFHHIHVAPIREPNCVNCGEAETFHNPVSGGCTKPGFTECVFQTQVVE